MQNIINSIKKWFKKSYNRILTIDVILLIVLLFNSFVFKIAKLWEISLILLPFLIISIIVLGYEKETYRNKKDVLINLLIFILIYYFITYILGLLTGFVKTGYSLAFVHIVKNIFPLIILIVISEILRYILFSKSKGSIVCYIIGFLIFVLIDINMMVHLYNVFNYAGLTKMICLVVFPSITKNLMLIYLTRNVGYTNGIVYRLLTELGTYLLPIFPDFGEYINVLIKTVLPIIIMVRINTMFNYFDERKIISSRYNNKKMLSYTIITILLFIIVTLTSGYFKYQALSIGSGSMSPKIEKGDVVIVKKVAKNKLYTIKKGDVLVYNHDNRIIVHRVVKIIKVKGKINFMTKGDNNNANDSWVIKENEIIGITEFRIKWIGMPTVALNELINR